MKRKKKKIKMRSAIIIDMLMNNHGGPMKDRRSSRGGSKNKNREYKESVIDDY